MNKTELTALSSIANFAQSFPLSRSRLKLTLDAITQNPSATRDDISEYGGFNKPVADGFVGWARHTGLIRGKGKGNEITAIGQLAQIFDGFLLDPNTLWLLHYFLCIEHEERSEAWYIFANQYASPGLQTSAEQFRAFYEQNTLNMGISKSAYDKDAALLINCYTSSDALGNLGIMRSTRTKHSYEIWKPALPDIHIRAFGLFDYWNRQFSTINTVSLGQLVTTPSTIGKIFMMTAEEVKSTIYELASMGLLTYSDTQHRPVNRIFHGDPSDLIATYYKGL